MSLSLPGHQADPDALSESGVGASVLPGCDRRQDLNLPSSIACGWKKGALE